ncbi:MAG: MATE family efflux transporter [Alphaproteobacteria bacterium]
MNAITHLPRRLSQTVTLWSQEARATVSLAVPLVLIALAWVAMVTTDRVMMGWLGPESLAAGSLAGQFFLFFEYFAIGVLGAVAPILSQHLGARRYRMVRRTVRQGFWVAVILAFPCMAMIWHAQAILVLLGQDPDLASAGQSYVRFMVLGFLPGLWLVVLSAFLAAHTRPRATLVVTVLGIGINALADYALMFGHFGFPRLGLIGAGVASAAVSTFMFLALLSFVLIDRRLRRYRLLGRFWRADWSQLYEIVRLGLPIAVAHLAEVGMFLASTLLMGLIGTAALAAHAIANQCAVIVYMVPYGIAQAATVRVGRAVGAGTHQAAARAGWAAVALGIGFAFLPAAAFWFLGGAIVDLFLDTARPENRVAIDLAVSFLAIAALLQFADGTQCTAFGALRGLKDTRGPMLIALAGYWGLGLMSAAVFGVYLGFGGQAIWISLAVALSVVGALLVRRFSTRSLRLINATHHST